MSPLHPTQLNELGRIIYEERLQEAELSRRLAAMNPANGRSWFSNLSRASAGVPPRRPPWRFHFLLFIFLTCASWSASEAARGK